MSDAVVRALEDLSGFCVGGLPAGRRVAGEVDDESVNTEEPCTEAVEAIGLRGVWALGVVVSFMWVTGRTCYKDVIFIVS